MIRVYIAAGVLVILGAGSLTAESLVRSWEGQHEQRRAATDRQFVGSPEDVAAQIQERVLDRGVDGVVVNMVANGHEPGVVEMAVSALSPLVR